MIKNKQVINKILPQGTCSLEDLPKYQYINQLILEQYFYKYVFPFKYQLIDFVIVKEYQKYSYPSYHLYYEPTQKYLLSAKKQSNSIGCNYVISKNFNPSKGDGYVGKLRGNFLNTQFHIYDSGLNPDKGQEPIRAQLALINFQQKSLWGSQPNIIKMLVPKPSEFVNSMRELNDQFPEKQKQYCLSQQKYQPMLLRQLYTKQNPLLQLYEGSSNQVEAIKNVAPCYNHYSKNFELKLNGNNCQSLKNWDDILRTGIGMDCLAIKKRTTNTYNLKIGCPLTILQGFGFFLANIQNKGE